jgi:predicted transcriptional regulator
MIKNKIGENAGLIWNILNEKGELPISKLVKLAQIDNNNFYMALGWLAREGKIDSYEKDDKQMVQLIH